MEPVNREFFRIPFLFFLFSTMLVSCRNTNTGRQSDLYESYNWQEKIRDDHPKLFFNESTLKKVKERALNEEGDLFNDIKVRIDRMIGQPVEFRDPTISDGTLSRDHSYGFRAAESAFLYRVLKEEKYLGFTKDLLKALTGYYNMRFQSQLNIDWYAYSRIGTLCAFDWIYSDLTEKERTELGGPLFSAINDMLPFGRRKPFFRENQSDITTGFYGPPCLAWYAGIVFHKTGINDELAEKLLRKGYDDHIRLLEYRKGCSGDDGGAATAVLGYCMGAYPWAEFNFFHTFFSATGLNIAKEWPYVPGFLYYVHWNWLPGDKEFGYGDAQHFTNDLPLGSMHIHLAQMIHFYGDGRPEMVALAKWMQTKVKRPSSDTFPFARFLLTNTHDEIEVAGSLKDMPSGMHFENMGQVFMRSGSGENDTYALFTAGGRLKQHRHYDNNNFVIFKKGFRALDTGTRPQPGLHLSHYYARTIAHNCILIHMPGEVMPDYWGGRASTEEDLPVPNDGGQSEIAGSEIVAFDENKDYVYIASDATLSYHEDKSKLVLRQFVFLIPDHFVIFDRVVSAKPEYRKTWLLHTASEPQVDGNEFHEAYDSGKLFCRTIFPRHADLAKTGGSGKQFWSDGRNWPLPVLTPDDWTYRGRSRGPRDTVALLGQWRIEVVPAVQDTSDCFLHLIQVGDKTLQSMVSSEAVEAGDMSGVRFGYDSKEYEVMFATRGKPGGRIRVTENGRTLRDEPFTGNVKLQKGLF